MTAPDLLGFGETQEACALVCFPQIEFEQIGAYLAPDDAPPVRPGATS